MVQAGIGKRVGKEKSDRNNLQLDCSEELHGAGEGQGKKFQEKVIQEAQSEIAPDFSQARGKSKNKQKIRRKDRTNLGCEDSRREKIRPYRHA